MYIIKKEENQLRNKMFKFLMSLTLIFTTSLFAINKDKIKDEMTNKIEKSLLVLKNPNLSKEIKGQEIISMMDYAFDYDLMSRLSLGRAWNEIDEKQREEFILLFTKKLKDSYVEKIDLYSDESLVVEKINQTKKTRIELITHLIGKNTQYEIIYKFYEKSEDNWVIYDVDIIGVSIIQTYRKQFSGYLNDKSFDELLKYLKSSETNL